MTDKAAGREIMREVSRNARQTEFLRVLNVRFHEVLMLVEGAMKRRTSVQMRFGIITGLLAVGMLGSAIAHAASPSPIYIHMNGLNDFLPKVVFVRPGQPVVWVNQDQGAHSIHGYKIVGGAHLKDMDKVSLSGTPGPGHKVHTYTVTFKSVGVHYYVCTIHAHLVKVYDDPSGKTYYLPAKRHGIPGYRGSMAGVIVVTNESTLLNSDPPITHQRILKKFWGNGDVSGQ